MSPSINTARLAARMGGKVQFESHAQRIRRFLAEQVFDWVVVGRLRLQIAGVATRNKFVVAVDRTNGDFGQTAINFPVISVVVCGVGVPVVWKQLGKVEATWQSGSSLTKKATATQANVLICLNGF